MARSCCRGRDRIHRLASSDPDCKILESGGAGIRLWPISTDKGIQVTVRTQRNGYIEVGAFLATRRCTGPTTNMLRRYLDVIRMSAAQYPSEFLSYRSTGVSLTEVIRLAERLSKSRSHHVTPVLPHT
jgi:hypothetical protein